MTTSMSALITACLVSLGDSDASQWNRASVMLNWCNEAMFQFPILRPRVQSYTMLVASHEITLTSDFREIISVEYPTAQEPPVYLVRKNRFDPDFYTVDTFYDIDRNYTLETGWSLWTSKKLAVGQAIKINYLANHKADCTDSTESFITVPDEFVNILVAYVTCKAYRERLGAYMQDPTAHQPIIQQMTHMVDGAEDRYAELLRAALAKLVDSRTTPHMEVDKFDRVY